MIEVPINGENLLVQVEHAFVKTFAVSLFAFDVQGELLALGQVFHTVFEGVEGDAKPSNKHEGAIGWCLFDERFLTIGHRIELVSHGNKLVVFFFHCYILLFIFSL